ncbi:hypothetical protein Airi02_069870 [Actinoallomurus iriomotensis]|uniref:Uncharacterized protein n=1 Tax=Actinoallomurus iriomotensis TaxID=478107 RepID=A0A9W6S8K1_9ACTN|nr:hypothetical protein Airi02_069870 [Actinoallomurus iriomotensis]
MVGMNSCPTFSRTLIFLTRATSGATGVGDAEGRVDVVWEGPVADRAPDSWHAETAIAPAARAVTNLHPNVRRTRMTLMSPTEESKPRTPTGHDSPG